MTGEAGPDRIERRVEWPVDGPPRVDGHDGTIGLRPVPPADQAE